MGSFGRRFDQSVCLVGPRSAILRVLGLAVAMVMVGPPEATAAGDPQPQLIIYPAAQSPDDDRGEYPLELLKLALERAHLAARLEPARFRMSQGRAMAELETGESELSVLWGMTSSEREQLLLPIRIPIDKGLGGWRVALVRADRYDIFADVHDVAGLSRFVAGQGSDWLDVLVLRAAKIPVETAPNYDSLFLMLAARRFDYFPRSLIEISSEVEKHRADGLIIEPSLVLRHPAAMYFFVNKSNVALAKAIKRGLEVAIKDGSFDRLFYHHFARAIEAIHLGDRLILDIANPTLPKQTPLERRTLWFHADDRVPRDP